MVGVFIKNNLLIEIRIEMIRKKMIKAGLSKGFSHPRTLFLSEKLDKLLNRYQRYNKKNKALQISYKTKSIRKGIGTIYSKRKI